MSLGHTYRLLMASDGAHGAVMYLPSHARPFDLVDLSRTTARAVIARLRDLVGTSASSETVEQSADRRAALRHAAGAELQRLEAERDAELPRLAAAEEKARRRLEAVTPGYRQAVAEHDRAQAAHNRRAHDFAYAAQSAVRRIEAAAEPLIDEFCRDLIGLHEANLKTPIDTEIRTVGYDAAKLRDIRQEWTNKPSIEARSIAILAARNEAEAMRSDPDQSTIRERLISLVEALPDNSTLVKVDER